MYRRRRIESVTGVGDGGAHIKKTQAVGGRAQAVGGRAQAVGGSGPNRKPHPHRVWLSWVENGTYCSNTD